MWVQLGGFNSLPLVRNSRTHVLIFDALYETLVFVFIVQQQMLLAQRIALGSVVLASIVYL